ncbi:MAG: dephospho-CoA kinase [Alphaproteobacteria bacterium]
MVKSYSHAKIIGLTGSIASGKTTICGMFKPFNIPIFDADKIVHNLLTKKEIISKIEKQFPEALIEKSVDRKKLGEIVFLDPKNLKKLEEILHPAVAKARDEFIRLEKEKQSPFLLLDIPLLFETGSDQICDVVIVASVSKENQESRLKKRGLSSERIKAIQTRQFSDAEKCQKADVVIDTNGTLEQTEMQIKKFLESL